MKLLNKVIKKLFRSQISYSQCGEDLIIDHLLRNKGVNKLSYLDIGTNHPIISNNTYYFYSTRGSGVCVEPNPELCSKIRSSRPQDICLNVGVSSKTTSALDFYIMEPDTLSTFSKADAEDLHCRGNYRIKEVRKIPILTYNEIIKNYFKEVPTFVSIDVEGLNEEIVSSIDFGIARPLIFCVESIGFSETQFQDKNDKIIKKFLDNDYFLYADTYINSIFVDKNGWL